MDEQIGTLYYGPDGLRVLPEELQAADYTQMGPPFTMCVGSAEHEAHNGALGREVKESGSGVGWRDVAIGGQYFRRFLAFGSDELHLAISDYTYPEDHPKAGARTFRLDAVDDFGRRTGLFPQSCPVAQGLCQNNCSGGMQCVQGISGGMVTCTCKVSDS